MKYIRNLAKVDDKVVSVSPQIKKENRPFVGIVVICDSKLYCIPLTSPKLKHQQMKNDKDFSKMFDKNGKLIGAINFNNMIPVDKYLIKPIIKLVQFELKIRIKGAAFRGSFSSAR
jgi:protein AbiQ